MFTPNLPVHNALSDRTRLRSFLGGGDQVQVWEVACLVGMGALAAAAATFVDFSLKLPGHAILRAVFPMTMGLALAPRRGAGIVMSASAAVTTVIFSAAHLGAPGTGSLTSLLLVGPLLDAALWRIRSGWMLYAGFASAGMGANLIAFAVRGATQRAGRGGWWWYAPITYVACGLAAGLICGVIWFAARPRQHRQQDAGQ